MRLLVSTTSGSETFPSFVEKKKKRGPSPLEIVMDQPPEDRRTESDQSWSSSLPHSKNINAPEGGGGGVSSSNTNIRSTHISQSSQISRQQQQQQQQQQHSHYTTSAGPRLQQHQESETMATAIAAQPQSSRLPTHELDYHSQFQVQPHQQGAYAMHHRHRAQPGAYATASTAHSQQIQAQIQPSFGTGPQQRSRYQPQTHIQSTGPRQHYQQQPQSYSQQHPQQRGQLIMEVPPTAIASSSQQQAPPRQQYGSNVPASSQRVVQQQQISHNPFVNPRTGRPPQERPIVRLSVSLIETYQRINRVYYEEREARRAARRNNDNNNDNNDNNNDNNNSNNNNNNINNNNNDNNVNNNNNDDNNNDENIQGEQPRGNGPNNNGWDDELHDYIFTRNEVFNGHYLIQELIGRGSFGQVVRAIDLNTQRDVAIKIIKNRRPFLMQARTEIELLVHLRERDPDDQHNIVRLLEHFMYRNHQCIVFEMLSLNLYELLRNTHFRGVSLNLIRKFGKHILTALKFLARRDVDIIHCDLKPENILLKHPKRSGVKVIDFGSSCRSNRRMYNYIQSRFYRSPEVMLGLPYSVAIDMWSLGCILVEMHTGEPLFSGTNQMDQMQKIVQILGMIPSDMLQRSPQQQRSEFFESIETPSGDGVEYFLKLTSEQTHPIVPSSDPVASLLQVTRGNTNAPADGPEVTMIYGMFVDLIHQMLAYRPEERITPEEALQHPFLLYGDNNPRH